LRGHRRGSFSIICFGFGRGINPFSKIYVWLVFNTASFAFCRRRCGRDRGCMTIAVTVAAAAAAAAALLLLLL
jgi:hypothetical protein